MSELSKSERIFLKGGFGPSQEYLDVVTEEQDAWTWVDGLEHVPEEEMEDTPGLEELLRIRTVTNPRIVEPAVEPQNVE